jgi:hypothetical protein
MSRRRSSAPRVRRIETALRSRQQTRAAKLYPRVDWVICVCSSVFSMEMRERRSALSGRTRPAPSNNEKRGFSSTTSMGQLSRHSLWPIASSQHPSAVAKHDQSTRILLDTGSVDRSGGLEVGVPIKNLLDAGRFTARLEKLDRVFCNVGRHWPDSHDPRLGHPTNFRIDLKIIQLSVRQSQLPATVRSKPTSALADPPSR